MNHTEKHLFILLVTLILIFSLSSCSNNIEENKSTNTTINSENVQTQKNDKTNIISEDNAEMKILEKSVIDEKEVISKITPIEDSIVIEQQKPEKSYELPEGFVYVDDIIPNIVVDAKYSSKDNFVGNIIDGYSSNLAILSKESAIALSLVQNDLNEKSLGLKIFDGYRPQKAVNNFVQWASDESDIATKEIHYPDLNKSTLIPSGYIASKSGHSRGSTVDLTIITLETSEELDMGTEFDFFGVQAHFSYENLSAIQKENRALLKSTMEKHGFKYYKNEWWHYTLVNEPYKDTYFDFDIK